MPIIPEIPISDRKIRGLPSTYAAKPVPDGVGNVIAQGAKQIGSSLGSIAGIYADSLLWQERAKALRISQEADNLLMQWKDHTRKGVYGDIRQNADGSVTQVPGINQKKWTDYQGTDGSALNDLVENQKVWEDSDYVKKASPEALALFNRRATPYRQTFLEAVNGMHDRNIQSKMIYEKKAKDASDEKDVAMAYGQSDDVFLKTAGQAAIHQAVREFLPLISDSSALDNPNGCSPEDIKFKDEQDAKFFRSRVNDKLYKYSLDRVTALTQNAAKGEKMFDANETSPEDALNIARGFINSMMAESNGKKDLLSDSQYHSLLGVVETSQKNYDHVLFTRAETYADNMSKQIYALNPEPDKDVDMQGWVNWRRNVATAIEQNIVKAPGMAHNVKVRDVYAKMVNDLRRETVASARTHDQKVTESIFASRAEMGYELVKDGNRYVAREVNRSKLLVDAREAYSKNMITAEGFQRISKMTEGKISQDNLVALNAAISDIEALEKHAHKAFDVGSDGGLRLTEKYKPMDQSPLLDFYQAEDGSEESKKVLWGEMLELVNASMRAANWTGMTIQQKTELLKSVLSEKTAQYRKIDIRRSIENQRNLGVQISETYRPRPKKYVFFTEGLGKGN